MAEDRDETVRRCGEQVLAVLGDAALPVAAVLDPKHIQAALEALSIAVAGAEYEHQKKRYKAAWAYLDALEGKDGTEEGSAVVLCPTCLHDGVLERTLERARAAEARLAVIAGHVRDRLNAPGRAGMSRAAAGIILGIAEGSEEEAGNRA